MRLASVLGLLVRHATFIADELAATQVVPILAEALQDANERVRRRCVCFRVCVLCCSAACVRCLAPVWSALRTHVSLGVPTPTLFSSHAHAHMRAQGDGHVG
jgi:hypothetical protein